MDDGFAEGMDIPIYYDPMIAKLIVHAETRPAAIEKMIRAINEYEIVGLQTTLDFCRFVMEHEAFRSGNFDTHFVRDHFRPELLQAQFSETEALLLGIVADQILQEPGSQTAQAAHPYQRQSAWRLNRRG